MSFLPIRQENENAAAGETTNQPGNETPQPPETGGSVGEEATGAPAKTSASGSPTQFGSSASKLGDYLSANAPQISQQADTLSGNLNAQYGNLNQGITDASNQFQQQVQGGYAANNPDAVNQAIANPTQFAADPNNVSAFQSQYNNAYTGPQNFEGMGGYADIQNQVGQAVQQGNLLGTQAGLQSYLQGQGNNPTQAMSTLDSLLLRGNPEAQQKINTAAGQFGNLTEQLGTATTGANQSVQDAKAAAQAARDYARGQFDPYTQQFGNSLNTNLATAQNEYTNQNANQNAIMAAINNNVTLTPQQLTTLGVDPAAYTNLQNRMAQYQGIYGSSPIGSLGNYLTQGSPSTSGAPTLANASSLGDYETAQALAQLAGQGYQNPLDPANIAQAGTANQGYTPGSFNVTGATGDARNQFISADQGTWGSYWPAGLVRSGDPFSGMPGNVLEAGKRLHQSGIQNTSMGKPYLGAFGSNPDTY